MNAWEDGLRVRRRVRKSPQQNLAGPYVTYNDDDSEEDKDELEFSTDAEFFTVAYDLKAVSAGQDVEARYKGTQMWYGAKVEKIHKENRVDIQYEDMDVEKNVSLERIRLGGYHPDRRQNVGTRRSLKDRLEMHADELQVTYLLNMLIRKSMLPSTIIRFVCVSYGPLFEFFSLEEMHEVRESKKKDSDNAWTSPHFRGLVRGARVTSFTES